MHAGAAAPVRTCVGCGARRPQAELLRVRAEDGGLALGPGPGRSAYLCPDPRCVRLAVRRRALPRRLRADVLVPDDLAARLGLEG